MTEATNLNQYLTAVEAARYLGISPITLRTWQKNRAGKIRTYIHPMSGRRIYLKKDLEKFLREIQDE